MAYTASQAQDEISFATPVQVTPLEEQFVVVTPQMHKPAIPVVEFSAYTNAQHNVTLSWTAQSLNAPTTFAILRSSNGKSFTSWRTVRGADGINQMVEFLEIDDKPLAKTAWYRLLQINGKGDTTFSEVRIVKTDTRNSPELNVYAFNENGGEGEHDVLVVLHDSRGEMHFSRAYFKLENGEPSSISLHQEFAPGTYVITAASKDELVGSTFKIK